MNSEKIGNIKRLSAIATRIPFCEETKSYFKVEGPSEIWNRWVLLTCNHTIAHKDLVNYREGQYSEGTMAYFDLPSGTISLWARLYETEENDSNENQEDDEVPEVFFNIETERISKGVFEFRFLPSIIKKEQYTLNMKFHQEKIAQIPTSSQSAISSHSAVIATN